MQSIISKLNTLVAGKAHGILDEAISNDPDALDQMRRKLFQGQDELRVEAAKASGRRAQLDKAHADAAQRLVTLNSQAEALVANAEAKRATDPGEAQRFDSLAETVVARLPQAESAEKDAAQQLADATQFEAQLRQGLTMYEAKITEVNARLEHTKAVIAQGRAQESASDALHRVGDLLGNAGAVDDFAGRAEIRGAVSQAKFDEAVGALQDPAQEALDGIDTQNRLAAIRARVKAAQLPAPGTEV